MDIRPGELLRDIDSPADLKMLEPARLPQLAEELRQYIVDMVSVYGGHFAASLGVVELTVAIHYVFNTPHDLVVWDVGHQAYGHKILTGRRDAFITNRKYKGISGFPKIEESEYDSFGVGHSSTSISAALGMAIASHYEGQTDRQHIAIIGDGALASGLAFEGMNHAGVAKSNLLIILNDNSMSIDPNVGALKEYFTSIPFSSSLETFHDQVKNALSCVANHSVTHELQKPERFFEKTEQKNGNFFECFNIRYFGPVDGHNLSHLVEALKALKNISGPKILHLKTIKGKGYASAEMDQTKWHAPGLFDKITGEIYKKIHENPPPPKYQDVFGHTIVELAKKNDRIMGITPAMPSGSSLKFMMEEMPDRAFDVGICEQHAVTVSAGLASRGMRVFCNIYSTFMQRAYDQVIHDVALQHLPVVFCLDRAGLVGEDGPTHHGAFDIAYMRCIPNVIVSAPMNETELRNLMFTAQLQTTQAPFVIRYPRGKGVTADWQTDMKEIKIGSGRKLLEGKGIAVLSFGHIGNVVSEAIQEVQSEGILPGHYDLRFVKPLDEKLLHEIFKQYPRILTVEDASIKGGFGSAVLEFMNEHHYHSKLKMMGIPDRFIEHGSPQDLYKDAGLDMAHIANAIRDMHKKED